MSLKQQAYTRIRQMIVDWELPPGSPLVENELSALIGVSRTPIREALQQLTRERLVRTVAGRGAFVSEITPSDIIEIYQFRDVLETGAARLAARAEQRERMREFIAPLRAARQDISGSDVTSYYRRIGAFDHCLAELTANTRLQVALADVWSQASRLRKIAAMNSDRLLCSVDEHIAIASAIADGAEERAVVAVRTHLAGSLRNIMTTLSSGLIPVGSILPTP